MSTRLPSFVVDASDEVIEAGGQCGLFIDMALDDTPPRPGDWVATKAGSRYLVDSVRPVRHRGRTQRQRYQMGVLRLPKHTEPPDDVAVIWLTWYPRGARH